MTLGAQQAGAPKKARTMRKLSSVITAALFGFVLLAGTAVAQGKKDEAGSGKVKVYDFSGDTIEGDLIKPEGLDVNARDFAKHSSLIRIRKEFIAEILKSAEDL
jgi:hypothetical protein